MSDVRYTEAAAFDDESLAALASRGLLRRAAKILDQATVENDGEQNPDDQIVVTVGAERVVFGSGIGVAKGQCSCATVGPCQHLLAAIITLRDAASSVARHDVRSSVGTDDVPAEGDATASDSLMPWLLDIGDEELRGFAGAAALRWALPRVDETADVEIADGPTCVVRPVPGIEVRFMGRSLESAFCAQPGPHDRRNIALAVLAVRAHHGVALPEIQPTETTGAPRTASDIDPATARRVLNAAASAVRDAVGIGVAHPSPATRQRFELLAVEARGVGLPRVGQLAARLETHYEEAIALRAAADPGELLADLALLHLIADLSATKLEKGTLPRWLRGVARADYSPVPTFEALGLGAMPWSTRSGHAGMTGVLYDLTNRRFVEVSTSQRTGSVDPASLVKEPIGWSTGTNLAALSGRKLQIAGALLSPNLRLSTSAKTSVHAFGRWSPSDLAICEWDGVVPEPTSRLRGRSSARWAVVAVDDPTSGEDAWFDPVSQRLWWTIISRNLQIDVVLHWQPHLEHAVGVLERLSTQPVTHVIGRLSKSATGSPELTPASVVVDGRLRVLAVGQPARDVRSGSPDRARDRSAPISPRSRGGVTAVESLGGHILELAERGVDSACDTDLAKLSRLAANIGCASIARTLAANERDTRSRVLLAAHLIEEHRAAAEVG